ncbi:hypothetical protein [Sphingorhabdus sp. EL138]|uniref:hypothetical protein n=1 Tax=Sphingorhabdus sp. EL138 TaxID=2073156 RepID=UPI000D6965CD|nr:hypothetical protein [Sphingorhabdus sp. EL138]
MFATLDFGQKLLVVGGILSLIASLLHVGVIIGGPDWYRFFGAGEDMAQLAERGSLYPVLITMGIASIIAIWAWFAFAGAGLVWKPPLLRTGLVVISVVYLARGLIIFPMALFVPEKINSFAVWSSLIVLIYGLFYAVGTWKSWSSLS